MSLLNPFSSGGLAGELQNGLTAAYNPFKATKEAAGSVTSKPAVATTASDIYAQLTRDQWENYVSTFVPIENQLISYATDSSQPAQAMAAAHTDVTNSFAQQAGSQQRELSGLGVTLDPQQKAAASRATGLSQSLADVQGQNVARDLTVNRQQSILGNPAPSAASIAQQATGLGV